VDTLETSLLLESHFLIVDLNGTEIRHAIGFKRRTPTFDIDTLLLIPFFLDPHFLPLPETEGRLALSCDLDGLLLDFEATVLIAVHDLLVAGNEHGGWYGLVSELVLDHILLLDLLLHDHLVNFLLSDISLGGLLVTCFETEWLRHSHTISALAA